MITSVSRLLIFYLAFIIRVIRELWFLNLFMPL
jgi:hypothetical protein